MAGHGVLLAALLVQAHPKPPVLRVHVLNPHADGRADAGEGIDHQADQRAVAQANDGALQKVEVTLKTNTVGYHAAVDVYEDTLLNSLLFTSPFRPFSSWEAQITGTVRDARGNPAANELVTVAALNSPIRRVFTNAKGIYRVFKVPEGPVWIGVRGHEQRVALAHEKPALLDISLPMPSRGPPLDRPLTPLTPVSPRRTRASFWNALPHQPLQRLRLRSGRLRRSWEPGTASASTQSSGRKIRRSRCRPQRGHAAEGEQRWWRTSGLRHGRLAGIGDGDVQWRIFMDVEVTARAMVGNSLQGAPNSLLSLINSLFGAN
jgi:hypothetical protein